MRISGLIIYVVMNGIGVSGYISDMERCKNASYYVSEWNEYYHKLKKYRRIRNIIAHENNVDEYDVCTAEDDEWVKSFYNRIINQSDPLSEYNKAVKWSTSSKKAVLNDTKRNHQAMYYQDAKRRSLSEQSSSSDRYYDKLRRSTSTKGYSPDAANRNKRSLRKNRHNRYMYAYEIAILVAFIISIVLIVLMLIRF